MTAMAQAVQCPRADLLSVGHGFPQDTDARKHSRPRASKKAEGREGLPTQTLSSSLCGRWVVDPRAGKREIIRRAG